MPGHFCSFGSYSADDMAVHLSSFAVASYLEYDWERSPMAFDLPMNSLGRRDSVRYMSHEAMVDLVEGYAIHYHGRVFRNYDHGLDAYLKFAGDKHIYKYRLTMPAIATSAGLSEDDPYPSPVQYYLATGKIFEARHTPEEWAAMGYGHVTMLGGGTVPIDRTEGEDGTMPIDRTDGDAMPSDGGGGYA